jgi:hypothetical protein
MLLTNTRSLAPWLRRRQLFACSHVATRSPARRAISRTRLNRLRHWQNGTQNGTMILRWCAAGVLEAERSFRKVTGYRALAKLDAALRAHDAALDRGVDNRKQAA